MPSTPYRKGSADMCVHAQEAAGTQESLTHTKNLDVYVLHSQCHSEILLHVSRWILFFWTVILSASSLASRKDTMSGEDLKSYLLQPGSRGAKFRKINEAGKNLTNEQVDKILKALQGSPDAVEARLRVADIYRRADVVLDIIQTGDSGIARKAIRLPWLYTETGGLANKEFLVDTLFPKVSFTSRQKVINNIGEHLQSPAIADEIFEAISTKYGFPVASPILPACSADLIRKTLKDRNFHPCPALLLKITKNHPSLGLKYLEELCENNDYTRANKATSSVTYLMGQQPTEVLRLAVKHVNTIEVKLGMRRTRRILKSESPEVILDLVRKDKWVFEKKQLQKHVPVPTFDQLFLKIHPDFVTCFRNYWFGYTLWTELEKVPKPRRIAVIENAYKSTFNKELVDCPRDTFSAEFVALLPSSDERKLKIVEAVLEDCPIEYYHFGYSQERCFPYTNKRYLWHALKPTDQSIPELTKFLKTEKDRNMRIDLYRGLVHTCMFNEDSKALASVLKTLAKRSRNDAPDLRKALLEMMYVASDQFTFRAEHWSSFQELFQFLTLYKEVVGEPTYSHLIPILLKFISFQSSNQKSVDKEMAAILKIMLSKNPPETFFIQKFKGINEQRAAIDMFIKALPTAISATAQISPTTSDCVFKLITEIMGWNDRAYKDSPNNLPLRLSSYPWLEKLCLQLLALEEIPTNYIQGKRVKDISRRKDIFQLLCQQEGFNRKTGAKLDDALLDKLLVGVICEPVLSHCLRFHPQKLEENIDNIVGKILEVEHPAFRNYFRFVRQLKRSNKCSKLVERIREECQQVFEKGEATSTEITNALKLMSVLCDASQFLPLASQHLPEQEKLDASNEIDELDYEVKKTFAWSLKFFKSSDSALETMEKFCVGDYLKLVLGSWYSACLCLPEAQILPHLKSLMNNKSVSFQKHVIRVFFAVSPVAEKHSVVREIWSNNKSSSIRFEMLAQILGLLHSNPSADIWQIVRTAIETLTKEDTACFEYLKRILNKGQIYGEFTTDMYKLTLDMLEQTEMEKSWRSDVVRGLCTIIPKISDEFVNALLWKELEAPTSETDGASQELLLSYLLDGSQSTETRKHRLQTVLKIVQHLIEKHWNTKNTEAAENTAIYPARGILCHIYADIAFESIANQLESPKGDRVWRIMFLEESIKYFQTCSMKTFKLHVCAQFSLAVLNQQQLLQHSTEAETDEQKNKQLHELCYHFGKAVGPIIVEWGKEIGEAAACPLALHLRNVGGSLMNTCERVQILRVLDGMFEATGNNNPFIMLVAMFVMPSRPFPDAPELRLIFDRLMKIMEESEDKLVQVYGGMLLDEVNSRWESLFFN